MGLLTEKSPIMLELVIARNESGMWSVIVFPCLGVKKNV